MPVEFLTDEQVAEYGRFVRPSSRSELERFFLLNDRDRELVEQRRRSHNRLGFAIQLGTVRFLGTFLPDPLDVPTEVVAYQAGQLGIDVSGLRAYAERETTPLEHVWEIRREYGYREFAEAEEELNSFLSARCATSAEGPKVLFDRATAWLVERKVLLPGVTTLARLVASLRAEAAERLAFQIVKGVNVGLRDRLHSLLEVTPGLRFSELERLRTSPAKVTGLELERALRRIGDVGGIGAGALDLSALPGNRVLALARYGRSAKAPALRELAEPRRTATLVATIRHLEQVAIDDALDLFAVLMQTKLLARAERESAKEQLRRLPRFATASAKLATPFRSCWRPA
jgi:Domain of unknown function (DUF4158)